MKPKSGWFHYLLVGTNYRFLPVPKPIGSRSAGLEVKLFRVAELSAPK